MVVGWGAGRGHVRVCGGGGYMGFINNATSCQRCQAPSGPRHRKGAWPWPE